MIGKLLKLKTSIFFYEGTSPRHSTRSHVLIINDLILVVEDNETVDEHWRNFIIISKFGIGHMSRYSKYYEIIK